MTKDSEALVMNIYKKKKKKTQRMDREYTPTSAPNDVPSSRNIFHK